MSRLKIETGVMCDDVRREASGKLIAIGLYATNLKLAAFPATLVLFCLIVGNAESAGPLETEFRALLDGIVVVEGKGTAHIEFPGRLLLPIPNSR
jgi:hypothetical protein